MYVSYSEEFREYLYYIILSLFNYGSLRCLIENFANLWKRNT